MQRLLGKSKFCKVFHRNCLQYFDHQTMSLSMSANNEPLVLVDHDERGVRRLTLNNPKKRNALSLAMIKELNRHIIEEECSKSKPLLRALVISSNCEKIFSSGHDLKELATNVDPKYRRQIFDEFAKLMLGIRDLPVPVICQVDGLAAAAGCQLVASCDMVLATERSHFSTPGSNVGLFCSTPGIALSRATNFRTATYMLLTGQPITANEAWISGLITGVFPTSAVMQAHTESILESILVKSASVIALGKKFFHQQICINDLSKAYSQGSDVMVKNLSLKDGQEGLEAFLEKRPPNWIHSNEEK